MEIFEILNQKKNNYPMSQSRKAQVFLSYANENLDKARQVYDGLTERGLKIWFDKKDLGPGIWKKKVLREISRSRYFVILISKAALRKTGDNPGFQDEELNRAYEIAQTVTDNTFTIIPVRIEDCDRGDSRIICFQQYDIYNDFEHDLDKLAIHMGGYSLSDDKVKDKRNENEKTIDRFISNANAVLYSGDLDKALILYDSILNINQELAEVWNNKGRVFFELAIKSENNKKK